VGSPDGRGGAVGLNILLTTKIDGAITSLAGQLQNEEEFTVGVFHRTGPEVKQTEFNFFMNRGDGGASWDGKRLGIRLTARDSLPEINIDLTWHNDTHTWSGRFERDQFRGDVVLTRPSSAATASPFVGTWFEKNGMMNNCLHIAQQQDGALTAWSDDLQLSGRSEYANGIEPPTHTFERYGNIAKVRSEASDGVTVVLGAYGGMCCPHAFTVKASQDGLRLAGSWNAGTNQAQRATEWKKMPGNSCVAGESPSAR